MPTSSLPRGENIRLHRSHHGDVKGCPQCRGHDRQFDFSLCCLVNYIPHLRLHAVVAEVPSQGVPEGAAPVPGPR